jgi:hypothetical protein
MLTVAGRRGRQVGGELSWGGLEGGEREATRALSLAALGSEAARAAARAACSATAASERTESATSTYVYIYSICIYIYIYIPYGPRLPVGLDGCSLTLFG